MKAFEWNSIESDCSDGCTKWWDVFLYQRNYRPCKRHDIGNRTKVYPGKGKIEKHRQLDLWFLEDLLKQSWEDCNKNPFFMIPHLLILILLNDIPVFIVVRLTHRFWHKHPNL